MSELISHSPSISGKGIVRSAVKNLVGYVVPMLAALLCIPRLLALLGKERFGFLAILWMVVGYMGVLDLGFGKALTKLVAEQLGVGRPEKGRAIFWTTLWVVLGVGIVIMLIVMSLAGWITTVLLGLSDELKQEAGRALIISSLAVPFIVITAAARGYLEAHQRFGMVSALRVPLGLFTYFVPLLVATFISQSLVTVSWGLVIGRCLICIQAMFLCIKIDPEMSYLRWIESGSLKPLMAFSGWMTLVNAIGPLIAALDRFVIGAVLSMSALASYVTSYEVITKLAVLPFSLIGVLFSAFSLEMSKHPHRAISLYNRSMTGVFLFMAPVILVVIVFGDAFLTAWLGRNLSTDSVVVLQILAIGVFINSYGMVPSAFIQGGGRPDLTLLLYVVEIPIYFYILWVFTIKWGLAGAATAWTLRIVLDNILLFVAAARVSSLLERMLLRGIVLTLAPCVILATVIWLSSFKTTKIVALTVAVLVGAVAIQWFWSNWNRLRKT